MGTNYEHLTAEERATLMVMRADGCSQRAVARCLGRSASTISRELARNASCCKPDTTAVIPYDASLAGKRTGSGPAPGAATKPKARSRYGAVRRHARLSARGLVARANRRQTQAR